MDRSIGRLTSLPVDLLLKQLTYLPFEDVVTICNSNSNLHSYCSNTRYNNNWKLMIDNTFNSVYDYQNKLKKIWSKLNIPEGTYNYLVYTKLIGLLDPLTQLMIYYKQGDSKSFNSKRFTDEQRFLSMFLLNKPGEMKKYETIYINSRPYYLLLQEKTPTIIDLDNILTKMAEYGNMRGVKYILEKGANIHTYHDIALFRASESGHLDVVKYLVEHGADIHAQDDAALRWAGAKGNLEVVKYLLEHGANIHANNGHALIVASERGHLNIVKYLVEHGFNRPHIYVYALNLVSNIVHEDKAISEVRRNTYRDIVRYLEEHKN